MDGIGYVLAGGSSRRLGRDKAFVEVGGISLVKRATNTLQELGLEVRVVCRSKQQARFIPYPYILDQIPGLGPAMAIFSALHNSDHPKNYFLACDMPLVPPDLFRKFCKLNKNFDVIIAADFESRIQPLCGYYSRACLPILEDQLNKGIISITEILKSKDLKVHILDFSSLDLDKNTFMNINDRKTLQKANLQLKNTAH